MNQQATGTSRMGKQHIGDLIDDVCDQFEEQWLQGVRPDITSFVNPGTKTLQAHGIPGPLTNENALGLVEELLRLDIDYRKQAGETPTAKDYELAIDPKFGRLIEKLLPTDFDDTVCIGADVSVAQFSHELASNGLVSDEKLALYNQEKLPDSQAESFARKLILAGVLTPYQANRVAAGNASHLVIGQYMILDQLGEGGMGVVYRAVHRRMDREVAIKVLSPAVLHEPEAVKRFYREARAAAKLLHPNIVTAFDADEHDGNHYLVMEYVRGEDLSRVLAKDGPLPINRAVDYTIQAAHGLQYAHEQNLIHRDIKPANILLDESGKIKILDLGLARIRDDGLGDQTDSRKTQLTQSGQIMGTVDYMAPEQAEDVRNADHRADIYSLGCTLHRLLTGVPVFAGDTILKRILAHRDLPVTPLKSQCARVPEQLDEVFQRMIAKQPDMRQQSMKAVIQELQACPLADENGSSVEEVDAFSPPLIADESTLNLAVANEKTASHSSRPLPKEGKDSFQGRAHSRAGIWVALAFLGTMLLGSIVVISLPDGTKLRVELNDPQIEVAVKGTQIILRKEGDIETTIEPGEKTLIVSRGDDFSFEVQELMLKKGDTTTVLVSFVDDSIEVKKGERLLHRESLASDSPGASDRQYKLSGLHLNAQAKAFPIAEGIVIDPSKPSTLEAWMTPTVEKTFYHNVLSIGATKEWNIALGQHSDWITGANTSQNTYTRSGTTGSYTAGRRVHIASVREQSKLRLFIDGKECTASMKVSAGGKKWDDVEGFREPYTNQTRDLILGKGYQNFTGTYHTIRISSVARYEKNFAPRQAFTADKDTVALYLLDETDGETFHDSSNHGFDGKIGDATWSSHSRAKPDSVDSSLEAHAALPLTKPADPADAQPDPPSGNYGLQVGNPAELQRNRGAGFVMRNVSIASDQDFTVEFWCNIAGSDQTPLVMYPYALYYTKHAANFNYEIVDGKFPRPIVSGPRISDRWIHWAMVVAGNEGRQYIDGKLTGIATIENRKDTASDLAHFGNKCCGVFDEIRISNIARYTSQSFTPQRRFESDEATLGLLHLDEGDGIQLIDASGNTSGTFASMSGKYGQVSWVKIE